MEIVKVYDYQNSNGELVYQSVRFNPKSFRQRRPLPANPDRYAWGLAAGWYEPGSNGDYYISSTDPKADSSDRAMWLDKVEPVLYNLPAVLRAIEKGERIIICEGEKDADNIGALGHTATTCPMGAEKWRGGYTKALGGCKNAILIADKDAPGRRHVLTPARQLTDSGTEVKVIEMPDLNGTSVKDFTDWREAGGPKEEFEKIIAESPVWQPPQNEPQDIFQTLVSKYGSAYYRSEKGVITSLCEPFWAGLHATEHIVLFEPKENCFYQYDEKSGLYLEDTEHSIKRESAERILAASRDIQDGSLEKHRKDATLKNILAHLKGITEKKDAFEKTMKYVHLGNGVLTFNDSGEADFVCFSPTFFSRNQSPINFDPEATCPRFLNELLFPAVNEEDAILIQKYAGLCLLGINLIQRVLILDGTAGGGKSTLSNIFQKVVGSPNVTELRTKHLSERFELYRYLKKTLLVGVDVSGDFLSEKGASRIKGLVGNDGLDAERKNSPACFPFRGNFCLLITSNSRLHIRLEGDEKAWKRRLLIVRFEAPPPQKPIPGFDDILIKTEGSGILNWALQGLSLLFKDIQEQGDIHLGEKQQKIVEALLAESDSLRHFLKERVIKDEKLDLSVPEIVEAYAEFCPRKGWNPKPITIIHRELESLMLELFATAKAHSIRRDGKAVKGFRDVCFKPEGE